MYSYSLTQWVLFFFWYCFLGWIWECFYVSARQAWKKKKWTFVNRGFLMGPLIPIYGFAAITILLTTIQLRENTIAVYVIGALTATIFELVTGTAMERLFKVKYWDYSDLPLNYHGHICLFVSMFWGFFSVLLIQVIHVPVEKLLMQAPVFPCEIAAFSLMAVFTYDVTTSFNEAMDLRDVLESLSENSETLKRLERRFDAIVAFTPVPDIDELRDMKLNAKENLVYQIEKLRWKNEERINRIKEYIQLPELEELPDKQELLEKLELHRKRIMAKSNKQFLRAMNQLKRNPGARSEKYQEMLELLNELLKNRD
ncbi:MAG: hypothetical protein IJ024_02625 [Lachnospiraceae bacterium]|nr:hypothetical protein [Lachnospiraceae bacterium]